MSAPIAVDFETFYSGKLKYSVKRMIAEQYCQHSLFDAYMISVSDGANTWAGHPKDFNWQALEGRTLLSHNAYFDRSVYNELVRRKMAPQLNIPEWHCTANLTSFLCNRRALDSAVEHLLGIKVDKTARAEADNKHWPQGFSETERERMLAYARSDALRCWEIWDRFGDKWPAHERKLSDLTIRQGMRGIQINVELLNRFICQTHEMLRNSEELIPWIKDAEDDEWEDFNAKPTSTKCIAEQCRRTGIPSPPVKSDDEEAYAEWETLYAPKHPWINAVSAWRSINKLYKTFLVMKERLRPDGTLPFALKYFGGHTGRWSGDARVNLQNQRKRPIVCNEFGLLEMNDRRVDAAMNEKATTGQWPAWVKYTIDFRNLIIPRPGKKMIVSDLSQIEPRVLAWLAGDKEMLRLLASGMSPYEAHARNTMNWLGGSLKKENAELYALAKARVLALGYQAGWEKFIVMAYDLAGVDVTKDDPEWIEVEHPFTHKIERKSGYGFTSKKIVAEFRANNPKIKGLWEQLDGAFKQSVGEDFTMTLPSGRKMTYEKVRGETRIEPDPETGKPRRRSVYTAQVGFKREQRYGGKLTENITQAIARDVFGEHLIAMDDNGWDNLFGVHDEAVQEVDKDVTVSDIEHEMSKCPDWLPGCPIAAEAHEVECYTK